VADVYTVIRGGFRATKGMKKGDQDKFLSRAELRELFKAAAGDRRKYGADAWDLFFIAGNFGLRCSEVLDLQMEDFKPLRMGYFRVRTLKRRADLDDRVYAGTEGGPLLQSLVDRRKAKGFQTALFTFGTRTARYLFAFYAKKAGLSPNVSFHSLRHTSARFLLEATGDGDPSKGSMRIVNSFLRHKPTTTEIYTTPSPEEMTRAMDLKGIIQ
jgi:integrase